MGGRAESGGGPLRGATLIAGPTASGKSGLALARAVARGGVVVNADSMQVYSVLRLLTARPSDADLSTAPHLLYGHADPAKVYSTGAWLRDVAALTADGAFDGRPAIFVGGTGLYFKALTEGLSEMPEVPDQIRAAWRSELARAGAPALHAVLAVRDPQMAARLNPADGQRIVRALEVLEASGRSIAHWQVQRAAPLVDLATAEAVVIEPDRDELGQRIETRFAAMVEGGALDEVRALLALRLDPRLPAMKAIGVPELAAILGGDASPEGAISEAVLATRQYAKRQSTWFRNQLGPQWRRIASAAEFNP